MTASDLDRKVSDRIRSLDMWEIIPHLTLVASGQKAEVMDESGRANRYYQWLAALMRVMSPKQVVELGAAAGISTAIMASQLPQDSKLISVDCDPQAWRWMNREYPQVIKVLGDDLDLNIYKNKGVYLSDTDIWFIDSEHTGEQLQKEIDLYKGFWKPGAVVVLDDIRINEGMLKVWESLPYDKFENSNPCHYTGFGLFIV